MNDYQSDVEDSVRWAIVQLKSLNFEPSIIVNESDYWHMSFMGFDMSNIYTLKLYNEHLKNQP